MVTQVPRLFKRSMTRIHISLPILILALSSVALAHHGKKFLVVGSHELSAAGTWHALLSTEYGIQAGQERFGIEPGILYGISRSWDIQFHSHHSTELGFLRSAAIAIESRLGLFGSYSGNGDDAPESNHRSSFGMSLLIEVEKGFDDHEDSIEGRVILGGELESTTYALNVIWQQSLRGLESREARYALGLKNDVVKGIGIGLEFEGPVHNLKDFRWMPGFYISASEKLDLKIGASFSVFGSSNFRVLRTALVLSL